MSSWSRPRIMVLGASAFAVLGVTSASACGSSSSNASSSPIDASSDVAKATDGASPASDASVRDASDSGDPRCATMPVFLGLHPHAPAQATDAGSDLCDTRGFHGLVYFGYGDLDFNTGPIVVSSYDPSSATWTDHFTLSTERIERYRPIDDHLYAPAADPRGAQPDPEYAVADNTNNWGEGGIDIGQSLHVTDAVGRVPGDVYLVGSAYMDVAHTLPGAAAWRAQDGGAFTQIFPEIDAGNSEVGIWFVGAAALNETIYVGGGAVLGWTFDGTTWTHGVRLGEFTHPTTFAGKIVSATLGELWSFDGENLTSLGITLWNTPAITMETEAPLAIFQETENHLVAVSVDGSVLQTTDLVTWDCIGKAPPDVRSISSSNGTIYFGGAAGRVYAYATPSW